MRRERIVRVNKMHLPTIQVDLTKAHNHIRIL